MRIGVALIFALLSLQALAQSPEPQIDTEAAISFCKERGSGSSALQNLISKKENQLAFTNEGGLFGGGVCWWHSRFTRASAYLAVFDPNLPKPTLDEAKKIIQRLRDRKGMTLIPGYSSLAEFSEDFGRQIQSKLNEWQRSDGIFKAAWVKGLSGKSEVTPENLSLRMDELYDRVSRGEVVYQMLQMPGIVAHAWLVIGMERLDDGYKLTVIDSNIGTDTYTYRYGMMTFDYHSWFKFVPYTGQVDEETKLQNLMTDFCGRI